MKFDNKNIIIVSTLFFVFLLVLFNLEKFTGQAGKVSAVTANVKESVTTVKVIPDRIKAGNNINVHITPGTRCADREIKIYEEGRSYPVAVFQRTQLGSREGYRFCKPSVASYKSWPSWHGNYYVLVKDIASNTYVKASFFIE